MERKTVINILLAILCLVVSGFLIWSSIVKVRAARYLEQQIASGKIKIEVSSGLKPSAN